MANPAGANFLFVDGFPELQPRAEILFDLFDRPDGNAEDSSWEGRGASMHVRRGLAAKRRRERKRGRGTMGLER